MNYIGNSAQDYFNHATNQISKLTRNMKEKVELKAQEVNSIEKELITRKRTAKMFLDDIVLKVEQGLIAPEFATLQLKQLAKQFKLTELQLEEYTMDSLVGTDHYIWGDYKITRREGSKTVDYSECEDIVLMEKHLKEMKGKYKAALEGVTKGNTILEKNHCFIDADGTIQKLPKWKYNKSSIVLTKV